MVPEVSPAAAGGRAMADRAVAGRAVVAADDHGSLIRQRAIFTRSADRQGATSTGMALNGHSRIARAWRLLGDERACGVIAAATFMTPSGRASVC
jgi:hypothetical protein